MDFDLQFIGAWNTDVIGGFETQNHRTVAFKKDGTGWFSASDHGVRNLTLFGWSPTSTGWVVLWTTRKFEMLSNGRSREIENREEVLHLPFQVITEEETEVLHIEIWSFGESALGWVEDDSPTLQAPLQSTSA